jgi:hypothetical protein
MTKKPTEENVIRSESAMVLALRDHFHSPEYILLPQVRNGVGFSSSVRTADALAMSVWPSRGLHLFGIEIKVHRNDWLREKADPKKADSVGKFCDFWVIAAGSESIVKDGELPSGWGLIVPGKKPGSLRMAVPPSRIEEVQPISRSFLAAILRKTFESHLPASEVEDEISRRVNEQISKLEAATVERITRDLDAGRLLKRNAELEACVKAYADAAGVWMDADVGRAKKYGRALKVLSWQGIDGFLSSAEKAMQSYLAEVKVLHATLPRGELTDKEDSA